MRQKRFCCCYCWLPVQAVPPWAGVQVTAPKLTVGGANASASTGEVAAIPVRGIQAEVWIKAAVLVGIGTPSARGTEAAGAEGASGSCCSTNAKTSANTADEITIEHSTSQ